ncbi:uncharacterized protein LOC134696703 [Mytilus trossulus]|uniref:uncharacterized protein LOC134696703 n=1 Tax=Mytilus trossulus TaxID=6551 RepID=UPI003003B921
MDPGHIMVLIVVIGIGIVLFIVACLCCLKLCDSLFTCCSYLNGRCRSKRYKRTKNRKEIRYSGFNRLLLQHHSTETQKSYQRYQDYKKLAPIYAKPSTKKLTRTESTCVICLEPKVEADIIALRCAQVHIPWTVQ